ncbi:MAG: flagellar basal body rod protein FlgB [Planctomycetota bacterium]|jgi:flagellar basal-body rod protein FlgB|nr:flagellar basal body rod protein FlgB [Planctomycetota bacterium]
MIERLFHKGTIPLLEKNLSFAEQRHRVLANNVANVDTPLFKAKDLPVDSFRDLLDRSLRDQKRHPVGVFRFRGNGRIESNALGGISAPIIEEQDKTILRHDKNRMSMEIQMSKMNKNMLRYNVLLDLLRSSYRGLNTAISERPSGG